MSIAASKKLRAARADVREYLRGTSVQVAFQLYRRTPPQLHGFDVGGIPYSLMSGVVEPGRRMGARDKDPGHTALVLYRQSGRKCRIYVLVGKVWFSKKTRFFGVCHMYTRTLPETLVRKYLHWIFLCPSLLLTATFSCRVGTEIYSFPGVPSPRSEGAAFVALDPAEREQFRGT